MCVTTQLPGEGGFTGGKIIYIDTENTFRPARLREIADRYNLDHEGDDCLAKALMDTYIGR